jgi:hypothetical protein
MKTSISSEPITVGSFRWTGTSLMGPAEYMKAQGNAFIDKALSGQSSVLNYALQNGSCVITALLVAVQTDYASWKGTRQLLKGLG